MSDASASGPRVVAGREGKVFTIRLDRPERANSLTIEMLEAIKANLAAANADPKVRVIVITGTGSNFTTGMDVNAGQAAAASDRPALSERMERLGAETATMMLDGKPVICAVNGRAMGMGVVWALASDLRVACEGVTFQMPEINNSIYPAATCITLMTLQLGMAKTKEILMTCKPFTAEQALAWGLVGEVLPRDGFMERVATLAKELSRKNATLLQLLKRNVNAVHFQPSFAAASELERAFFVASFKDATGTSRESPGKGGGPA